MKPVLIQLSRKSKPLDIATLVDADDLEMLQEFRWGLANGYARTTLRERKNITTIYMHRYIMGVVGDVGMVVDHINGDTLDNRRCNLRVCSKRENGLNVRGRSGTSIYIGVSWSRKSGKWEVFVPGLVSGKRESLGLFSDEIKAALRRDEVMRERFGRFAKLNFPSGIPAVILGGEALMAGMAREQNPFDPGTAQYLEWERGWLQAMGEDKIISLTGG